MAIITTKRQSGRVSAGLLIVAAVVVAGIMFAVWLPTRGPAPENLAREPSPVPDPATAIRIPILASSSLVTLDPIKSVELVQYNIDLQIFEGLVSVGVDGAIEPALAASWDVSEDRLTWRFKLRDARFADDPAFSDGKGRKVTAADVIYSWERGLNAESGSLNSWALSGIVRGAEEFAKGEAETVSGLQAVDKQTLQVRLTDPDRDFLTRLTVLSTAVVPREVVETYGEEFGRRPVGSGPFKLAGWTPNELLRLEPNPHYGVGTGEQPTAAHIDYVEFVFFRSEAQIIDAFNRGEIHVRDVAGADIARIGKGASVDALAALYPSARVIRPGRVCRLHLFAPMIGGDYALGGKGALRRALATAYDHAALKHSVLGPLGEVTETLVLPSTIIVDNPSPSGAEATPSSSDVGTSLKGREVRVAYVSSRTGDVAVALLKDWLAQQGASVRLFPSASIQALFASVGEINPDLTLIYWSPYFPNLSNYVTALLTRSQPVPNFTGFSNPELDRQADLLRSGSDEEVNVARHATARLLDQEMPWIPLYYETPLMLITPAVQGFRINPVSVMLLKDVRIVNDLK